MFFYCPHIVRPLSDSFEQCSKLKFVRSVSIQISCRTWLGHTSVRPGPITLHPYAHVPTYSYSLKGDPPKIAPPENQFTSSSKSRTARKLSPLLIKVQTDNITSRSIALRCSLMSLLAYIATCQYRDLRYDMKINDAIDVKSGVARSS